MYVSGGPGTGKTCSVRAAVRNFLSAAPDTRVLEVNCMDLGQRSIAGLLQRLLQETGGSGAVERASLTTTVAAVAARLGQLSRRIVLVVDEVDQLVPRGAVGGLGRGGRSPSSPSSAGLETLFSLPYQPGVPALAIVAIANAVDLLHRLAIPVPGHECTPLLFEPYTRDQLRDIVKARLLATEAGEAALKALGPVRLELGVRKVAKQCGDCRQVLSLCEEALSDMQDPVGDGGQSSPAPGGVRAQQNDPLQAICQLPLEQQMLLCALAGAAQEAVRTADVCVRYKDLCRMLRQPQNLGSRGQVVSALSALEQRGLLELRRPRGRASSGSQVEHIAELSICREKIREAVLKASPVLQRCFE